MPPKRKGSRRNRYAPTSSRLRLGTGSVNSGSAAGGDMTIRSAFLVRAPEVMTDYDLYKEWTDKAEADFSTAARELKALESPNFDAVCFHAQQGVEK